jgi:hypothetical protein
MSSCESLVLLSLEVAQMILALVLADARCVRRLGSRRAGARPHQVSIVVVDIRAGIEVSVGSEEDVSGCDALGL